MGCPDGPYVIQLPRSFVVIAIRSLFELRFVGAVSTVSIFNLPLVPRPHHVYSVSGPITFVCNSLANWLANEFCPLPVLQENNQTVIPSL